jgi:catechol 2,3-dioxygenase-like lactoylglutathione lyase family enzyme
MTQPNPGPVQVLRSIDHVQLAMPRGHEAAARRFYGEILGLPEVPKPEALAARGGCWFETRNIKVHLGVEEPFNPARKAHVAFRVNDLAALVSTARAEGLEVVENDELPGFARAFVHDPFGNRLEFMSQL